MEMCCIRIRKVISFPLKDSFVQILQRNSTTNTGPVSMKNANFKIILNGSEIEGGGVLVGW